MKNINRIAFFNFLSVLLLQGISFISAPLFSRLLGTDGYGNLASFNIWASILATVFSLQTHMTIANARVEFLEGEQPAYQSAVMTLSLLSYTALTLLVLLFLGPISSLLQMQKFLVLLMLLQSFGTFCVNFLGFKYTYEFKAAQNMLLSVFIAAGSMGLALLFVLNSPMEYRYLGRIIGNALVYIGVGVTSCIWILVRGKTLVHGRYWKFCLVLAWPMICQNLSYYILGNSDILMLKQMAGSSDSGIYSLAFTVAGIIFTIFSALNNSWVPFFFDDMKEGRMENVKRQAEHFLELFTVLSVGFILLMREVWHIYASEEYWPGMNVIPLFVGSYYLNFLCTFPVNYEYFHKKTGVVAAATIAPALVNLVLNYVFILNFGMLGAATATLLSHGIQLTMHEIYCRKVFRGMAYPFSLTGWLKYAAAYVLTMVLVYTLPEAWLIRWGLGAAIGLWELYRIWKRKALL